MCSRKQVVEQVLTLPGQERLLDKVTRKGWHWSWALNILNRSLPCGISSTGKNMAKGGGVDRLGMHYCFRTDSRRELWKCRRGLGGRKVHVGFRY